nr:hypothetical protein BgiMline_030704 [Biomphalaria glabrata]
MRGPSLFKNYYYARTIALQELLLCEDHRSSRTTTMRGPSLFKNYYYARTPSDFPLIYTFFDRTFQNHGTFSDNYLSNFDLLEADVCYFFP